MISQMGDACEWICCHGIRDGKQSNLIRLAFRGIGTEHSGGRGDWLLGSACLIKGFVKQN